MARNGSDWFNRNEGADWNRRAGAAQKGLELEPADFDPAIGTLRWERFAAIMTAERERASGALLVIDLDNASARIEGLFENSQAEILPLLAQSIQKAIRAEDLLAHLDGYRFAVLLLGAAQEVAVDVTARIRQSVEDTLFMTDAGIAALGVAVGSALFAPAEPGPEDLLTQAMRRLRAAQLGEDRDQIRSS